MRALTNRYRMLLPGLLSLAATAVVWVMEPLMIGNTLHKIATLTLAAWASYWLDRCMFPYARPHIYLPLLHGTYRPPDEMLEFCGGAPAATRLAAAAYATAQLRRALIVAAGMISAALVV